MKIYVPYQPVDLHLLAVCLRSIRQYVKPAATEIVVIGPPLPKRIADELGGMHVGWMDEDTLLPGLTRRSMPEIPFAGHDLGGKLFTELLSIAISLQRPDPRYAVMSPSLVFIRDVVFAEGDCSVLPVEGRTNTAAAQTASLLVGAYDPHRAFSKHVMVFDRQQVMNLLATVSTRMPGRRIDEAVMDCLDLDNPGFSINDTYGWYSVSVAGPRLRYRQSSSLALPHDMSDDQDAASKLAVARGCESIYYQPGWLRDVDEFLEQTNKFVDLAEVSVMLDVGSRDGQVALSAKRRLPKARIFSFDCDPDAIQLCRSNLKQVAGIEFVERAVNDASGSTDLYAFERKASKVRLSLRKSTASSLLKPDPHNPFNTTITREITVQAITLKEWAENAGIPAVDLLWMDLQGAELAALRGMGDLLKTVKVIYTEVEYKQMYQGQPTHEQLAEFMKANGFRLQHRTNTSEWFGNELYVRADLPERPVPAPPAPPPSGTSVRVIGTTQTGGRIISFEKPRN